MKKNPMTNPDSLFTWQENQKTDKEGEQSTFMRKGKLNNKPKFQNG